MNTICPLIIRKNNQKDLVLSMNNEKVYFLFHHGIVIYNNLCYDLVSDKFNQIEKGV